MNKQFITVVALSVDREVAVLYLKSGDTYTLRQGDPRLPAIVEACKEPLSKGESAVVDVTEIVAQRTEFTNAEKGTNGLVKFFRVAKSLVKDLLKTDSPEKEDAYKDYTVSPIQLGKLPGTEEPEPVIEVTPVVPQQDYVQEPDNDAKMAAAQERLSQLASVGKGTETPEFHKPLNEAEETIVAVNTQTGSVIPDAQKLAPQLRAASKLADYTGFTRFVERLENVIHDRGHSVQDLMKFIEKGDLPIADDGCIVIYKRLKSNGDHFVDCHSGKVKQKVGSYVFMQPGLVDPNRRRDCSNGLHVASAQYITSFSGDVTVIAKVRPEDVFAVPEYDVTKMRVCGYHIVAQLEDDLRDHVNGGKSLSDLPQGAIVLNQILRGNHIGITQTVEIGGAYGTNLTITEVKAASADDLKDAPVELRNTTLDLTQPLEPVIEDSAPVEAKTLAPVVEPKAKPMSKIEALAEDFMFTNNPEQRLKAAHELLAMKKKAKKSWAKLGLEHEGQLVEDLIKGSPKPVTEAKVVTEITAPPVVKKSRAETAKAMFQEFWEERNNIKAQQLAIELIDFKRKAKVGWDKLGITPDQVKHLEGFM